MYMTEICNVYLTYYVKNKNWNAVRSHARPDKVSKELGQFLVWRAAQSQPKNALQYMQPLSRSCNAD